MPSIPSWGEDDYFGFATGGTGFYLVNNFEDWSLEWQAESMHWGGATSASGDTFGFNYGYLYLPVGIELGSLYTPRTTWVWESNTLEGIGLDWLTTTPYELSHLNGETISIALAPIPEPSSVIFIGLAGLSALLLRRRSRVAAD